MHLFETLIKKQKIKPLSDIKMFFHNEKSYIVFGQRLFGLRQFRHALNLADKAKKIVLIAEFFKICLFSTNFK